MTPNPILKVLSTLSTHQVQYLLMGGQACVFYGAAEFSRDCDIAILCDPENLHRLQSALHELEAQCIAVPPFKPKYLERGHAVHFRCLHPEAMRMRVDVMSKMRGVALFADLWQRRTTLDDESNIRIELMGLADLIQAKKTQRDKDWPMIRRLVEASYATHCQTPTDEQLRFWLLQSRTPEMIITLVAEHPELAEEIALQRSLVLIGKKASRTALQQALNDEEARERDVDRHYWAPLKAELEQMRFQKRKNGSENS